MKRILFNLFMLAALGASAQQDILVSQYMFNPLLLNPAYAGSKDYMMATLLYRKQWVNFKGAPETQVATIHGPLGETSKFAWGAVVSHDKILVTNRTDFYANAAYHLPLNQKWTLSMGLRGGGSYYNYRNSDLKYWEVDPAFDNDYTTKFLPNVGWGLYLYSEKFYAGMSNPSVLSYDPTNSLNVDASGTQPRQVRHYFFTTGAVFELHPDVIMKPSVLLKYVPHTPVEADFNLNFLFANTIWVGGSYRTGDCFVALVELQVSKKVRIGYSYDVTFSPLKNYSAGSHEIMIAFDFGYDIMKIKTPRYF